MLEGSLSPWYHSLPTERGYKNNAMSKERGNTHHAEGLVYPKVLAKKTVADFGYLTSAYQLFSKRELNS
jgi:hypothetical protein